MDPNECLRTIRGYVHAINNDWDEEVDLDDAMYLAGAIESLDHWLSSGGFLPTVWQEA